jgi:large subunit ribosomal protein L6
MVIKIPSGVNVSVDTGNVVRVKGPKGELAQSVNPAITVAIDGGDVKVARPNDEKQNKAMHGLYRSLIANMITGVTAGYAKELEIVGTGYRAAVNGKTLVLNVGYSHQVEIPPPAGIAFETPVPTRIVVRGFDKNLVGETAAQVRRVRQPEPYMGKGIRYLGEVVKIKEGKAAGK